MTELAELIKPEEITIKDSAGNDLHYILSNFSAVEGREIVAKYFSSAIPKVGDYAENEKMMLKIMRHVCVMINGQPQRLETVALINNHCIEWETLAKVEAAMIDKNCGFFRDGRSLNFLNDFAQMILTKISETLTLLSVPSSPVENPPSNS